MEAASMFRPISACRRRAGGSSRRRNRLQRKREKPPARDPKKNFDGARNRLDSRDVDNSAPGEAPQPLTLNHPALNPGRSSGRGSLFSGSLWNDHASCAAELGGALSRGQIQLCHSGPTTRSSRCTISVRPLKPRIEAMSADERPRIFSASSAS